ncbi:hypothetical protein [Acetomicrobium sp.]|uniref:hypothetical protein n=1 Tax=Acetomicrobium sp. TaxID=1872099 RepID=UPI002FC83191
MNLLPIQRACAVFVEGAKVYDGGKIPGHFTFKSAIIADYIVRIGKLGSVFQIHSAISM